MATIKPAFKEYEYGFYGFVGSFGAQWFQWGSCHKFITTSENNRLRDLYSTSRTAALKQIPKLKGVIFIYGDYKEVI